ncbi:uncharacterized protein V1516DRAFT_627728 [Lipomyces oligophaga]|uniref:uncharacterized protein n=1 Tax=Lipomyces oligophaga TaxID=45792 RepID=UPI0034CFB6E3
MSYGNNPQYGVGGGGSSANLQFYSSNYENPAAAAAAAGVPSSSSGQGRFGGGRASANVLGSQFSGFGGVGGIPGTAGVSGDGISAAANGERLSGGLLAAFGTGGYSDESPLLEELGINFNHIKSKTLTVLNPLSPIDTNIMDDSDLAGPILFFLLFGTFLLLSGKIHFGYVYGVALLGLVSLHLIMNLMAATSGIDFTRTTSVLGYCLLPLVVTSAISIFVSADNLFGYIMCAIAIFWCTYSSSAMFVAVLQLSDMRPLVAYPLMLFYSVFAVMTMFADKS